MFSCPLYIQLRENHCWVRNLKTGSSVEIRAEPGFSHPRMLVGNFSHAQTTLSPLVAKARGSGFVISTPVLIHPLEKVEGGLSQVEERMFQELAMSTGASRVVVWIGAPLNDAEALAKLAKK